jgi:hypothetical protein
LVPVDPPSPPPSPPKVPTAEVEEFLNLCRALQSAAARLCREESGLGQDIRKKVVLLRRQLLEARQVFLPLETDGSLATSSEGMNGKR